MLASRYRFSLARGDLSGAEIVPMAVWRGVGRLSAARRHQHPRRPNLPVDERHVIALAHSGRRQGAPPGQGSTPETDREAPGREDGGETAMHANQIAPTRRDAGCCLPILLPSRLKVLPEPPRAGAERLSEFHREVIACPSRGSLRQLASMRKECRNVRVAVKILQDRRSGPEPARPSGDPRRRDRTRESSKLIMILTNDLLAVLRIGMHQMRRASSVMRAVPCPCAIVITNSTCCSVAFDISSRKINV